MRDVRERHEQARALMLHVDDAHDMLLRPLAIRFEDGARPCPAIWLVPLRRPPCFARA